MSDTLAWPEYKAVMEWAACADYESDINDLIARAQEEAVAALPCLHKLWCFTGTACGEDHKAVKWHEGMPCPSCQARAKVKR